MEYKIRKKGKDSLKIDRKDFEMLKEDFDDGIDDIVVTLEKSTQ